MTGKSVSPPVTLDALVERDIPHQDTYLTQSDTPLVNLGANILEDAGLFIAPSVSSSGRTQRGTGTGLPVDRVPDAINPVIRSPYPAIQEHRRVQATPTYWQDLGRRACSSCIDSILRPGVTFSHLIQDSSNPQMDHAFIRHLGHHGDRPIYSSYHNFLTLVCSSSSSTKSSIHSIIIQFDDTATIIPITNNVPILPIISNKRHIQTPPIIQTPPRLKPDMAIDETLGNINWENVAVGLLQGLLDNLDIEHTYRLGGCGGDR